MTTESNINKKMFEERLFELYGSAKMFFEWSEKYRDLYNNLEPNDVIEKQIYILNGLTIYLKINSNLYFFYSVNTIATLLSKKQENINKKELSLFEHLELLNGETKIKATIFLNNLLSFYKESGLDIIRNKIIAHKDLETSGDPVTHFFNFINPMFYDKSREIISNIFEYLRLYNFDGCINNYSKEYFDKSHLLVLNMIKNKLTK